MSELVLFSAQTSIFSHFYRALIFLWLLSLHQGKESDNITSMFILHGVRGHPLRSFASHSCALVCTQIQFIGRNA